MLEALQAHGSTASGDEPAVYEVLRGVAERLLAEAKAGPPTRQTALTLLAADAFMTFACEAVAEAAPDRLAELA